MCFEVSTIRFSWFVCCQFVGVGESVCVCVKVGEIEQLVLGSHVMQVCAHVMQVSHVVLIIETHAPIFRTSH